MCGRLDIDDTLLAPAVSRMLGFAFHVTANRDLRPTQTLATLIADAQGLRQRSAQWGIQPRWSKRLLINAQSETVMQKPTFRAAFQDRRCLVPCSGWYEWRDEGAARKQKYRFGHVDDQPLYMAALWYADQSAEQATPARIVTLTTASNARCAVYHARMPLLILPEDIPRWFAASSEALQPLMSAVDNELIRVTGA